MAQLSLQNISKVYGDKTIIDRMDLEIQDSEFIVIVGPSGCGKSTLLRMVAGLESVSTGNIQIGQQVVNQLAPKDRNIAMVFQNYALYPHMTVFENMAYGLRMRGLAKQLIRAQVEETAKILELEDYLQRKPYQLSGGQRQRVAMGRAIVRHPAVFLFDEPLSNLDAKLRVQMRLEIKKLHKALKTTSLYVTHDQMEAMTLADRLVVLNKGKIEQIGTPIQIYRRPASLFVASFIGSPAMNFIPAQISHDGQFVTIANRFNLPIDFKVPSAFHGKTITLGLRPENINEISTSDPSHFDLEIDFIESMGSDTYVYGHLPETSYSICARFPGKWQKDHADSKQVSVTVRPNSLHLFDPETQKRIVSEDDPLFHGS